VLELVLAVFRGRDERLDGVRFGVELGDAGGLEQGEELPPFGGAFGQRRL
jgi:hypothetical protein